MIYIKYEWQFGFSNADDLDEDDFLWDWKGMTQYADTITPNQKILNRSYLKL